MKKILAVIALLLCVGGCANTKVQFSMLYQSDAVLEDLKELKASTK
jgi:hypothetical protein